MSTCQTCKHWSPAFTGEEWNVRSLADAPRSIQMEVEQRGFEYSGFTPSIIDWYYWGECTIANMDNYEEQNIKDQDGDEVCVRIPKTLALAQDGSGYTAKLNTRCNFGCVQYKLFQG